MIIKMILIILKSLFLGFLVTVPLGPIGILCVRKILQSGPLYGFILGSSQALVFFIFGIMTIFGLDFVSDFIIKYQFLFRLIGGCTIIGFGVIILFSKSAASKNKDVSTKGLIADFFSIAFLLFTNPPAWLAFIAIFAALGLYEVKTFLERIEIVSGILIGSIFSWMLVCLCFAGYKTNTTKKVMTWMNRAAGTFLVGFGIAICISAILL
jgi:threonine/homoserine/homoserine lactone efflux protein